MKRLILGILFSATASAQTPVIQAVVSAANGQAGPFAPGSLISIFGSGLAGSTLAARTPLPTTLGGVSVQLGGIKAPLLFVSPGQINAQIPWEVSGAQATLSV